MGKQITYLIYILITFVYIFYIHQSLTEKLGPTSTFTIHEHFTCTPGVPVAQHFNSAGQSITDIQVRGTRLCVGTKIRRKQLEMKVIFQLGTAQPEGLNMNFKHV